MGEIISRTDIEFLVDRFYKNILADKTISHFFTEVAKLDWEKHMPIMYDFWETALFGGIKYKGNPMAIHMHLNKKETLKAEHFDRWIHIWETTINNYFSGDIAKKAIEKAKTVSEVMMLRLKQSEDKSGLNIK